MMHATANNHMMTRYLLGELSEEEQMEFEENYFTNADLYDRLLDAEDELIRKYVNHELSNHERRLFEQHILFRPRKREKVKLAKALMVYLAQKQPQSEPLGARLRQTMASILHSLEIVLFPEKLILKWSYAIAFLVMIFVSSRLTLEMLGIRTQLEAERLTSVQREQKLQQQAEVQQGQNETLVEQLQSEQNQRAELEKRLRQQSQQKRELFTVGLIPGVPRSAREANKFKRSQIDQSEQLVRLQLYIGSEQPYENYRVILETAEGDTIWSQYQLQAQQTEKGKAVVLLLPTNILPHDDYLITLKGVLPSKEIEDVNNYYLNVVKE